MLSQKGDESSSTVSEVGVPQRTLPTPVSDPSYLVANQTSRKRKHAEVDDRNQLGEPFSVKVLGSPVSTASDLLTYALEAHPSLPSPKALHLTPRLLLLRSSIPLAYLDQVGGHDGSLGSRLFSARLEVLEAKQQEDWQTQATVLIAQSTEDRRLHAVERVQTGIYALCMLGSWVTLGALERLSAERWGSGPSCERLHMKQGSQREPEWWHTARTGSEQRDNTGSSAASSTKNPGTVRLCLQRPFHKNDPLSETVKEGTLAPTKPPRMEIASLNLVEKMSQSPEEALDMIKYHYLEALYASKTSLAYFAKGPLSRARATFHSYDSSAYDQSILVQYLRSSILSLPTIDIKYRETLPTIVKDLPFGSMSDDGDTSMIAAVDKRFRKSKRTKVGKNGLHAGEDVNLTRWWLGRDTSSMACDSTDARENVIKATLLEQRARETQLQIILSLETLALEASKADSCAGKSAGENLPEGEVDRHQKAKKRKKPQDLATLVEILADRLCIWQSMGVDEAKTSNSENSSDTQQEAKLIIGVAGNDHSRQFCMDVVLPFYGNRLSAMTTMLCEKLGGSKQALPKRPPLAKAIASSTSTRPGSAVQRQQFRRPQRTLERVLTDERSASQVQAPSVSRSATDSMLPRLKREQSDTSLSSIPLNKITVHKRYSQREVDLNAASQAMEAKLKRKAKIDQELQSAIAALKKPNPRVAVKEFMDSAEKRLAGSRSRKAKNTVRNSLGHSVQIMATPSKSRHHDISAALPRFPQPKHIPAAPDTDEIPPSSVLRVSDSAGKTLGSSAFDDVGRWQSGHSVLPAVEQTPTRGPLNRSRSLFTSMAAREDSVQMTPHATTSNPSEAECASTSLYSLPQWPFKVQETPSKGRTADHSSRQKKHNIEATPRKPVWSLKSSTNASDVITLSSSQEQDISIYASLGWDDDADERL